MSVITNMSSDLNGLYKDIHSFAFTTSAKFIIKTSHKIKKFKSLFGQINGLFFTLDWSGNENQTKKNKLNHMVVCHGYIYTENENRSIHVPRLFLENVTIISCLIMKTKG